MDANRQCGSCSLCCKVMGIEALDKPPGAWCGHFKPGLGCGIYARRPGECVTFACEWLMFDGWGPEWKPEKSRFVMFTEDNELRLKVIVDPATPDAWKKEPYYSRFKAMSRKAVDGQRLLIVIGNRYIVVFPDADHDLGELPHTANIISGMLDTPMGLVSYAHVKGETPPAPHDPR